MIEIAAQFNYIESTKFEIGGPAFFSREHKKTREWQVLGALQKLLIQGNTDFPVYAQEQEEPDFLTFSDDSNIWSPVEIVEVLRPDYERQKFHKEDAAREKPYFFEPPDPLDYPFEPLRQVISKKASKAYARDISLVIYYDIGKMSFNEWDIPFQERLFREHESQAFNDVSVFKRVLIMSSDFECLVEMHPHFHTIKPDSNI